MRYHLLAILIITLFASFGLRTLLHPGLFTAHDIWHQVARFYYYDQAIRNNQFPPTWVATLAGGFGYPLFIFSYPLPWLIGEPLLLVGLDLQTVIKALFFIAFFASGFTMYAFLYYKFKTQLGALLGSIIYLWAPYHFLEILVSAAMGIVFVFVFLPLLLLGIEMLARADNKRGIIITSLGLAGVILSHLMHIAFLAPTIFLYLTLELCSIKDFKKVRNFLVKLLISVLLGLVLSAFYLLPAITYSPFIRARFDPGFTTLYQRNFIDLRQLIYSKWGYGPIINNAKEGAISFQLGIAQWLSLLAVCIVWFTLKNRNYFKTIAFILIGFAINLFLLLDYSKPVWDLVEKFLALDYPFRIIMALLLFSSMASSLLIKILPRNIAFLTAILIIIVALYTNRNHTQVNLYTYIPTSDYVQSEQTTNTFNEYLPKWANPKLLSQPSNFLEPKQVTEENLKIITNSLNFDLINLDKEQPISVRQFYFPGQTLYIDKKRVASDIDQDGRIKFVASEGQHNIRIVYEGTTLMNFSKIITLVAILLLFSLSFNNSLFIFRRAQNKKSPDNRKVD